MQYKSSTHAKRGATVGSRRGHAGHGGAHALRSAGEETQSVEVESWNQVGLKLQGKTSVGLRVSLGPQVCFELTAETQQRFLTFMAAMSLSCDSLIFFITSFSARPQASMEPLMVMVRSGL